jgi:hypothetical protein
MKPNLQLFVTAAILAALAGTAPGGAPATRPDTQPQIRAQAEISLGVVVEDGERQIRATVQAGGKPVENVAVKFLVERSFGELLLGTDKTLDDGTAAVRFPADLPGGPGGELRLIAEVQPTPEDAPARARATASAGVAAPAAVEQVVPRALWSTRTPLPLACTIAALLAGVWATYAYAAAQLLAIRRETRKAVSNATPTPN